MATDQPPHFIGTVDGRPDFLSGLRHLNRRVEPERIDHPADDLAHALRRLLRYVGHRRRPERFFFLRGPGGGTLLACAPFEAVPASSSAFADLPTLAGFAGLFALPSAPAGTAAAAPAPAAAPAGKGSGGGRNRLMKSCWPIVQKFVVIQ